MGTGHDDHEIPTTHRSTATEAARIALDDRPVRLTRARTRILLAATRLWCRDLQFPTVRGIGAAAGLRSPSTVIGGFERAIDVQAAVIRLEWQQIERGWIPGPAGDRPAWLEQHGRDLVALDPTCLRLPGLVCAAVQSAGVVRPAPAPALLAPLHALAALVDEPAESLTGLELARVVRGLPGTTGPGVGLGTPA